MPSTFITRFFNKFPLQILLYLINTPVIPTLTPYIIFIIITLQLIKYYYNVITGGC